MQDQRRHVGGIPLRRARPARDDACTAPNGGAPTGLCSSVVNGVCSSYYERTWWAGDQILAEWRTADGTANPTNSGTVGYVHAPGVEGIDAPVAVITGTSVRVITEDWRGLGESSLFPNGAPADNTLYGGTAITVAWPSGKCAYFTPYLGQPSGSSVEHTWLGSLVEHGVGAAGLLYRRNRYYDPQSGRFTQQDPIGIAGGVNLYGFAGGDPVSYSDPFGLCPGDLRGLQGFLCSSIEALSIAAGTDIGAGLGGGAGLLTGPGAIVASPLGAAAGASMGAGVGAVAGRALTNYLFNSGYNSRTTANVRIGKQNARVDVELPTDNTPGEVHVQTKGPGGPQKYRVPEPGDLSNVPRFLRENETIQRGIQKAFDLLSRFQP